MKCEYINPSEMQWAGTIQEKGSSSVVNGEKIYTWTNKYTGVKSKRLAPLRGKEIEDERQPTNIQKDSWLIWSISDITPNMRYVVDGEIYYIESLRPYKGGRRMLVLDTVKKDNDGLGIYNPEANLQGELQLTLIG